MFSLGNKIPAYLVGKYEMILTCTFTAFFALLFMVSSIPFSHNSWFELGTSEAFGFTVIFFLIALLVVIGSKVLMYRYTRHHSLSFGNYILWNLSEVVVISLLYTYLSFQGDMLGVINLKGASLSRLFGSALIYCFISLVFPYLISGMYFAILDKDNTIRLMKYSNVVSDEPVVPRSEDKITLFDNSGEMKLSVRSSNLYYIESDDNYIKVWYSDNKGALKQYMLRCRLKTVEESFKGSSLVRCHRQYIINIDKVKVLRKEKDGYELVLDSDLIAPIPVTKTYSANVLSMFNDARINNRIPDSL